MTNQIKEYKEKTLEIVNNKKIKLNEKSMIALNNNFNALQEMDLTAKGNQFKTSAIEAIIGANNRNITMLAIINISTNGFVINKEFYLTNYKGSIVETKTASAWKQLAMKYGVNKPLSLNTTIVFNGDTYKMGQDDFGNTILREYDINFDINRNDYNEIKFAIVIINFKNNTKKTRITSKSELDKLKALSQAASKNSGPWLDFPIKMVEAKVMRDAVKRDFDLDNTKMYSAGYKILDDDINIIADDNTGNLAQDYIKPEVIVLDNKQDIKELQAKLFKRVQTELILKEKITIYLKEKNLKFNELSEKEITSFLNIPIINEDEAQDLWNIEIELNLND